MAATFRAAIFDFDGVLVDTIPLHHASYRQLFAEEGVEFTMDDYRRVASGAPRHRVIRAVLGDDLPAERFERLMARKEEIVLELAREQGLRPIDGVLELVDRLRREGLLLGVASSSRTARVFLETMQLDDRFDATTDARDTELAKPDPEVFLSTAARLGVEPAQCLVFEDAPVGVVAARAAGMRVVAITSTTSAEQLAGADWVIDSFVGFDPTPILFPPCATRP